MSVLLLNATFEPLSVITIRRAICLVLAGKADLVEHGDGEIRSATCAYPVPAVVRLRNFVRLPFAHRVPLNRRTLAARDGGRCQVAGCTRAGTTVDHIVPRSRGGRHEWANVALMCYPHNRTKSDRLLSELGWALKAAPRSPRGARLLLVVGANTPAPTWEPYLNGVEVLLGA